MNGRNKAYAVLVVGAMILSLMACADSDYDFAAYDDSLGSANRLEGTTMIVSVFADDIHYKWDQELEADQQTIADIDTYLGIATDYLAGAAAEYGKEADFVYDFKEHEDLAYFTTFDVDTTLEGCADAEDSMNRFISEQVDSDALRRKYKADNIIYFMFINTDEESTGYSCTRNFYEGMSYPYEVVFMYNIDSGVKNCPAVYAHEMLHAYGAPDLYYEDTEYGLSAEFLDYVSTDMANDIMYYCSDMETGEYVYDRVTNELSELDAYYVGLTDECPLVEQFHLKESQHITHARKLAE